ncbi:hypothetical protein [Paraglaciecola sp.]|uniref:hypothetical protein n=1 Tax=Paraglaciecola sp. TaxID=1920173 RepID=UPI003EF31FBB
MRKYSIIIFTFFISLNTLGSEFEFSLGGGFQYSGLVGTQFSLKNNDSKYYISVGLPGYGVGMQTTVSDNQQHTMGLSVGNIKSIFDHDSYYGFLTYNYHPSGFNNHGWVFGTGIGVYDEKEFTRLFSHERENPKPKAMITLDIGYKF